MKIRLKSLKVILSLTVACTIIVLTVVLIISSYAIAYKAVEDSFMNQLNNFNQDFNRQLVNFYEQQMNSCKYLAASREIKEAVLTRKYGTAIEKMTTFFNEIKLYENVFISTAEQDTVIVADGIGGKSVGLRWKDTGFNNNITETLNGKIYISDPYKSPATGKGVVLITAPVTVNGRIVAIMGLPCDVGTFSASLVGNTLIGKTGYPVITDMKGLTFAHPKKEYVFRLDLSKEEWGYNIFQNKKESDVFEYNFEGKLKFMAFLKNTKYRFITIVTIYKSDINQKVIEMAVIMLFVGLAGIALASAGVYLIISRRLNPLEECKKVMNAMAEGKLDRRYKGRMTGDEIGEIASFMNNALDQFEKLIADVKGASRNLTAAVQEIATGNQNLSQRTSEQASALEEIASTIEETTQNINQNAENSMEANKLAIKSTDLAENGGNMVSDAVKSINEIYAFSKKISEIITVINEIAFQTNLLALNAAVEAARAGEQGRGFAVVAGEVRNLAQRSGNAAKEISTLIQESANKIEHGTEQANLSGQSLTEIIESIRTVSRLISEMAAASDEQKQGINQINIAISELDSMTQQNAALVEETAASSEEMANQAQELESLMGVFTIRQ